MVTILYNVYRAADWFIQLISLAILVYCILTWVAPRSAAREWLERFISPFCAPFRQLARYICMRWGSPFDFTCWFAMIGISIVSRLLWTVYGMLWRIF